MASFCRDHADAPAIEACSTCQAPLCAECLRYEDFAPYCPEHAKPARTKKYGKQLFAVLGASLAFVAAVVAFVLYAIFHEPPYDHGTHEHEVGELREELISTPCDREKTLRLGDLLVETGDYPGAVKHVDRFFAKCGDWPRLRWVRYTANKYGRAHDAAIEDATKLIEHDPDDKDYRWWRGIVHEAKGDWKRAAADYEKAIEIEPRLTNIPFNLATAYERLGKPCDAARTLERFVEAHPGLEPESRTIARIRRLHDECGSK